MNVAVIGNDASLIECKARLGDHQYHHAPSAVLAKDALAKADVVFDFLESQTVESLSLYSTLGRVPVFLNTTFVTLKSVLSETRTDSPIFGFCGIPSFFNREILEVSMLDTQHQAQLHTITQGLNLKYIAVKDQVGFVTPRVVCMIINEAYDALKNGVASKADIDLSMKLGTNYPFGPFEWSERMGVDNVRKLLASIEKATGDVRYRPMF
jgi:3-hydroxybutyryl-CoA dehydrogenase